MAEHIICPRRAPSWESIYALDVDLLNSRAMELMTRLSHDSTLYQAACEMNISLHTANQHAARMRDVMGCRTNCGTIRELIMRGYI